MPEDQEIQGKTLHSYGSGLWFRPRGPPARGMAGGAEDHRCVGLAEGQPVPVVAGGSSGQAVLLLLPLSPASVGKCQTCLWVEGNVPL